MFTNKEKKELYDNINLFIKCENNEEFIKNIINIISQEEDKSLIISNSSGYYINFTKLNDIILYKLENYLNKYRDNLNIED